MNIFPDKMQWYKSIDELPIFNWFKIQDTNDVSWMMIKKKKMTTYRLLVLNKAFSDCQAEYLDAFGVNETYKKILMLKWQISVLRSEMVIHEKRTNKVFIDLKEIELKGILSESKKTETGNVRVMIEKHMGFKLNEKEITVKEFYEYLNDLKSTIDQQRKANERR